jgi:hypothetical protein
MCAFTIETEFTTRWKRTRAGGPTIEPKPEANLPVISLSRLGGLHHRYAWREAA